MILTAEAFHVGFTTEQRSTLRFPVALPVILCCLGKKHAATVCNLGRGGAMVRTALACPVGSAVVIRCGTTEVTACVAWTGAAHLGLTFTRSLSEAEVTEHLARSQAIAARRARCARFANRF
jgi:hypothetical protein